MLTIGSMLRTERERKKLSLEDVERKLRVRRKYLAAIEENNWTLFSSKIYIEGIIKNYAHLVGLDQKKASAFFRREYEKKDDVAFKRKVSTKLLKSTNRYYAIVGGLVLTALIVLYFGFQLYQFLTPPTVSLTSPAQTVFKRTDKVHIVGHTEKEATITIFGNRIYQDDNGVFAYDLPLHLGHNQIVIKVVGANGKETVLKKEFVLAE
jgi:cytoskeletal protein RodZ